MKNIAQKSCFEDDAMAPFVTQGLMKMDSSEMTDTQNEDTADQIAMVKQHI